MLNAQSARAGSEFASEKKSLKRIEKRIKVAIRKGWTGLVLKSAPERISFLLEQSGYRVKYDTGKVHLSW